MFRKIFAATCAFALCTSAFADITHWVSEPYQPAVSPGSDPVHPDFNDGSYWTVDLMVTISGNDDWTSTGEFEATLSGGQFFYHELGDRTPPPAASVPIYPALEFDTMVLSTEADADNRPPQADPLFVGNRFLGPQNIYVDGWYDTPPNGGDGDFVIARFTVKIPDGGVILTLQGASATFNGGGEFYPFFFRVPIDTWDYETIQEAIDAAQDGDEVAVPDGTWTGPGNRNLDFHGKAITVRSANGPQNCIIDCENHGRGFYFHSGETAAAVVEGFTIRNGQGAGHPGEDCHGGAICCVNSSPTISNCIFSGNQAWCDKGHLNFGEGGAIYFRWSGSKVTGCTFTGNFAYEKGGGMYNVDSSPRVTNCTFSGNSTGYRGYGAGMYNDYSSSTVTNCTFSGNVADWGGGMYNDYSSSTVTNCILWGDSPDEISGSAVVMYSDVQGGRPGEGNIDADPLFVDPGHGDYHLSVDSPCINAGSNYAANLPQEDIEGDPRIQHCRVDMGAYESPYAPPTFEDCNDNDVDDDCDIYEGTSEDCNQNHVPDECIWLEEDCNENGVPDECDIADGTSEDCNANGVPDECIWLEEDCNDNGVPDECEWQDCNENGVLDACDILDGTSEDCQPNGIPDECDLADGTSEDVNGNGIPDECDCAGDITGNGTTDQADLGILLALWGLCEGDPSYDPAADLNRDGCIGHADLGILLADWGCGT